MRCNKYHAAEIHFTIAFFICGNPGAHGESRMVMSR